MRHLTALMAVAVGLAITFVGTAQAPPVAEIAVTCDDYSNQREAQLRKDPATGTGTASTARNCPAPA
jgi:hypothetical protein